MSTDRFKFCFSGLSAVLTTFDDFLTTFDDVCRASLPGRNGFQHAVLFDIKGLSIVAPSKRRFIKKPSESIG
jgi:hypothetical protein